MMEIEVVVEGRKESESAIKGFPWFFPPPSG
jgi:hypothetical protein